MPCPASFFCALFLIWSGEQIENERTYSIPKADRVVKRLFGGSSTPTNLLPVCAGYVFVFYGLRYSLTIFPVSSNVKVGLPK